MFKQVRKITVDELVFNFEELDIEFEVSLKDDLKSDIAKISIYNLSSETKKKLKKNQGVVIEAGYVGNSGVIYSGTLDEIDTRLDGVDYKTTLICTPSNNLFTNTLISTQFNTGIKGSEILKKLETLSPYKVKVLEIPKDVVYPKGKVFSTRLSEVIRVLCNDMGAVGVFEKDTIIIKAPNKTYTSVIKIGSEHGLIEVSKTQDKKTKKENYLMKSFIIPELKLNQVIQLDSINYPGRYVIKELKHVATDINNFTVTCTLEVI